MAELRHNSLSPYKTRWHTARASRQRTYERAANSNAQARGRQTDALTSGGEVVAPTGRQTDALKSEGVRSWRRRGLTRGVCVQGPTSRVASLVPLLLTCFTAVFWIVK